MAVALLPCAGWGQDIDETLQSIARNNKSLKALQSSLEAAKIDAQAANSLGDFSVEYSPFFMPDVQGVYSSELIVSQAFDFPTLYGARNKTAKLRSRAYDWQYAAARSEVLLEAKKLCLDLVRLSKEQALLDERKANADELLAFFEKRLAEGDASILDLNKVKMEHMSISAEAARCRAARQTVVQSLTAMNGNLPLELTFDQYPDTPPPSDYESLRERVMNTDARLHAAEVAQRAAAKEVDVTRQNWLPKIEIGYRRNTELNEASNGFLAGLSLPLFSNNKQVKAARAYSASARIEWEQAGIETETRIRSLYDEMMQLLETLQAYDPELMSHTLTLLKKAVLAGQLSSVEYYIEADGIYRNMQDYLEVENNYQKVIADIYKNEL